RLRCGRRYRIWLAARDRAGRVSRRRAKLWVRTAACHGVARLGPPAPGAPGGSSTGRGVAPPAAASVGATSTPGVVVSPGTGIPPGGGTGGAPSSLPARLPVSSGAVYHVAKTGSDTAPGTETAPWRTVQKALNTLRAGDTVM